MDDYIDREEIKYEQWAVGPYNGLLKIVRKTTIDSIPAADVAPVVHGRWLKVGYVCGEGEFECSACHKTEWRTSISRFEWCPFCGARMDGDAE